MALGSNAGSLGASGSGGGACLGAAGAGAASFLGSGFLGSGFLDSTFLGAHGDDVKSLLDEQRSQKVQTGWEGAAQGRLSVKAFISFDPREERLA